MDVGMFLKHDVIHLLDCVLSQPRIPCSEYVQNNI